MGPPKYNSMLHNLFQSNNMWYIHHFHTSIISLYIFEATDENYIRLMKDAVRAIDVCQFLYRTKCTVYINFVIGERIFSEVYI